MAVRIIRGDRVTLIRAIKLRILTFLEFKGCFGYFVYGGYSDSLRLLELFG